MIVAATIPAIPNLAPTLIDGFTKVKSVPIIPETLDPIGPSPFDCNIVVIPDANIVAATIRLVCSTLSFKAVQTTRGTAIIPAKAASICCRASRIDTPIGGTASIEYLSSFLLLDWLAWSMFTFISSIFPPKILINLIIS